MYEQMGSKAPDIIICPIGGGGLIGGVISVFQSLAPQTWIVGVEPE